MASILDKYGIKEVADVTFYDILTDGSHGAPVLYVDTAKVTTLEQTAEQSTAKGGKGNVDLIAWDFNKEINMSLEDALFSAKSMAIMFGNGTVDTATMTLVKTLEFTGSAYPTQWEDAQGSQHAISGATYYTAAGATTTTAAMVAGEKYFCTFNVTPSNSKVIEISATTFPGTYYVTADTFARSYDTGKDEYFQFIIPKAKMQAEQTITLEAEGDPSTFNLGLKVLRPTDGKMVKLVQYAV